MTSAIRRLQRKEGIPVSGVVDERTIQAITRLGYSLSYSQPWGCAAELCQNEPEDQIWLVVFGHGAIGVFLKCCHDHPLEIDSPWPAFRFSEEDPVRAFRVMEEIRSVHEVMAS